jgi:hypothetical protein
MNALASTPARPNTAVTPPIHEPPGMPNQSIPA